MKPEDIYSHTKLDHTWDQANAFVTVLCDILEPDAAEWLLDCLNHTAMLTPSHLIQDGFLFIRNSHNMNPP